MGEILPPHLSPFIDPERDQQYIPPEARALYDDTELEAQHKLDEKIGDQEEEKADKDDDGESNIQNENEEVVEEEDSEDEEIDEAVNTLKVCFHKTYKNLVLRPTTKFFDLFHF